MAAADDFERFYEAEYAAVYRAAYVITGEREAALDASQEAFERAYVRWRRLRKEPWRGGWVMTTALNLCRGERRRQRERTDVGELPDRSGGVEGDSPLHVDVVDALRRLPTRQRMALVLFYVGDLPLPAIAQLMDVSEGTVKAHLAQGRAGLRKALEESYA